jgi:benzoate-CoA ligase
MQFTILQSKKMGFGSGTMSNVKQDSDAVALNATDEILGPTLAHGRSDDIAILSGEKSITFGELEAQASRFGNALTCYLGFQDRALLLLKDSPDFVAAYLGIMRIGAVSVALSTRSSAHDLAFAIADSGAKVLLIDKEFLPLYQQAIGLTPHRPDFVAVRGAPDRGFPAIAELVAAASAQKPQVVTRSTDMAFWLYTSGTTGTPKAAVHCHGDVIVGDSYLDAFGYGPGQRIFSSSKLFFAFALGHVLIGGLRSGSTIILYDGWPDGEAIVANVERYRPTIMLSVPAFFRTLLRDGHANHPDFKAVRYYLSAGEPLPEAVYHRWRDITGAPIVEGIGATETIFMMIGGTPQEHKPGATGKPFSYVEVKLLDGEERMVTTPGSPGTLWVRMNSLCRGYWQQPDKTEAAFRDGWFRTGDVFVTDDDGWWFYQGRADDLLKISGQWVSPGEIEECATSVPGVADAIVVGAQDEDGLVRLNMFLVAPEGGDEHLKQQVQDTLLRTLSRFKCPRQIVFVDSIPRTATGKARRFKLRQWASARFLQRLMRAIGLDPATVSADQPQVYSRLQRKCIACESHNRCESDLLSGTSASSYTDYCQNADILVSLTIRSRADEQLHCPFRKSYPEDGRDEP